MPGRPGRIVRSWLGRLRRLNPFADRDPFRLKSSGALNDPEVRRALEEWRAGKMTSAEFRRWLDEKWERDHS